MQGPHGTLDDRLGGEVAHEGSELVAAYLGGLTSIAIAAVVIGVMGDIVVARGMQPSLAQLVVGLGIVAAGVVSLLQERARA